VTTFEDDFSQAQIDMVRAALDYASGQADGIYIHFSSLGGILHVGMFFTAFGRFYTPSELPGTDTSVGWQQTLLETCCDALERMFDAGEAHSRDIPVEGYLSYRVGGSLDARYSYQDIPVGEDPRWDEKLDAWMQDVALENAGRQQNS